MDRATSSKWMRYVCLLPAVLTLAALPLAAQDDAKQRAKAVRELGKDATSDTIERLAPYLADVDLDVRLEAVKAIVNIGTQRSLDPLIQACSDGDAEIQIRATDGLVNFYLPGYIQSGLTATLRRAGTSIMSKFTDTNDQVIDAFIQVRPEVITALGRIASAGASMDSRANAARAIGILRGRQAVPDLEQALRSKNTQLIYESLVALEKIRDQSAGPSVAFLLNDLNEKVQLTAIEATGLLGNRGAVNDLRHLLDRSRKKEVKRAALTALAQMPAEELHGVYGAYMANKDEGLREAAAEGFARLKNPSDLASAQNAFENENKTGPRLAQAFALVSLGRHGMAEFDPLRYIVNNLNSGVYRNVARAYLIELARDSQVREALYPALRDPVVTKDEKTGIAQVFASSGDNAAIAPLEALSKDPDPDVAKEAFRALQNVRARP